MQTLLLALLFVFLVPFAFSLGIWMNAVIWDAIDAMLRKLGR